MGDFDAKPRRDAGWRALRRLEEPGAVRPRRRRPSRTPAASRSRWRRRTRPTPSSSRGRTCSSRTTARTIRRCCWATTCWAAASSTRGWRTASARRRACPTAWARSFSARARTSRRTVSRAYAIYAPQNAAQARGRAARGAGPGPGEGLHRAGAGEARPRGSRRQVQRAQDRELAGRLAYLFLGRTLAWQADLERRVQALTNDQVLAALHKHFDPGPADGGPQRRLLREGRRAGAATRPLRRAT